MRLNVLIFFLASLVTVLECSNASKETVWKWTCEEGICKKVRYDSKSSEPAALCLESCKMFCNKFGILWPSPRGLTDLGNFLSKLNINKIRLDIKNSGSTDVLLQAAAKRFKKIVTQSIPDGKAPISRGKSLNINIVIKRSDLKEFSLDMDESYELTSRPSSNATIDATIKANNFFGARHGLETLSQLIIYDDIRDHLLIVRDVTITDAPAYPYRGILLDTSRSYFTVKSIKSTLDAMASVKLNSFHWHITDSQSFPFVSERRPQLSQLGAYSPSKVYTKAMIEDIVQYGLERGIRVIPEFDAPAHVGEGWQDTDLTVCFKVEPWSKYCVGPPCGQFNPTKAELYLYLEDIYKDMALSFRTADMFHMGGDEVSEKCWNSSTEIQQFMKQKEWGLKTSSFLHLWNYFQKQAQEKAYMAFGKRLPLILWSSSLTDSQTVENYLNKDEYIIQVWTSANNPQIRGLLEKGYRLIMSNFDALYLDCGFGALVDSANNWCSPYISWQRVYENSISLISGAEYKDQMLGAEATLWSEQADTSTLDGRLWPRAAAMAERLWSDPTSTWEQALPRFLHMRERLARMGIQAEVIQPEWCFQNDGHCVRSNITAETA